jgi:putative transposase
MYADRKNAAQRIPKWVICRDENLSVVSFHRWKKQFGHMEINEARQLKELERENSELKKMLAESLLKNRVLEAVCEKKL